MPHDREESVRPPEALAEPPTLSVDELRSILERGGGWTVLDVRPEDERAEWFIPGSVHVDAYAALKAGDHSPLLGIDLPRQHPIATVCARGRTSAIAARVLRERGFETFSLAGGMKAWSLAWNTAEFSGSGSTVVQFRRTGKGCLSYIVASGSGAIVVDASLEPRVYVDFARSRGWSISHVLDTHIHADHLSRSRVLAEAAGASLFLPKQHRTRYRHGALEEGAELHFGASVLRALKTPGHTMESMCYLVDDRWLFTGDTLFLAAVGRPDLEASAEEKRARAILLHGSLHRLFELEADLLVLPGHTSRPVPFDRTVIAATLGAVRDSIRLPASSEEFAERVLRHVPPTPPNHATIIARNEAGELPDGDPTDLEAGANRCAVA